MRITSWHRSKLSIQTSATATCRKARLFNANAQNGAFVADATTDASGKATVPKLLTDWHVVSDTKAPSGYLTTEARGRWRPWLARRE
ncbi:MAG: prealbumin-like fold domain-containing protein [Clostridiales bacterium]|nr:prealbumin-like fold domain-containing protein [Clostridiales bacterium]